MRIKENKILKKNLGDFIEISRNVKLIILIFDGKYNHVYDFCENRKTFRKNNEC